MDNAIRQRLPDRSPLAAQAREAPPALDRRRLPGIAGFAKGLQHDLDAVTTGLTLSWGSGPFEGRVNHIKVVKRQMFGRAGLPCSAARPAHRPDLAVVRIFSKLRPDPGFDRGCSWV